MLRSWSTVAVLGAALGSAGCGGDAFTAGSGSGSGSGDSGTPHDASSPPDDTGSGNDVISVDVLPPIDATGEPPPSCDGNFACVPAVPAGWTGPLELYSGSQSPPACTTDFAQSVGGFDLLQAPPAMCGCACGASTITCKPPVMDFFNSMTCGSSVACASVFLTPGQCTTVDERSACNVPLMDITLLPGGQSMSDCAPQGTVAVPAYTWGLQARGCESTIAPAQVDCGSGQICAPKPEAGFDHQLCVGHAGDVACPGGGYGVKHRFFTSVVDTRACSACTCGPPSGGSCDFSVTSFTSSDLTCSGGAITYGSSTKCAGVAQPADFRLTMFPTNGSCGPSTSAPTGTATPTGPVTVCCPF